MAKRRKRKAASLTEDQVELDERDAQRNHPNQTAGQGQIVIPQKKWYRQRPHVNPFSDHNVVYPSSPEQMDWHFHFSNRIPDFALRQAMTPEQRAAVPQVEFADIGCGFGGLLFYLAPLFPQTLMVGMEIRSSVVQYVYDKVQALRVASHNGLLGGKADQSTNGQGLHQQDGSNESTAADAKRQKTEDEEDEEEANEVELNDALISQAPDVAGKYDNISALRVNAMKHLPNFFRQGQLTKLFFLHPDPHFKQRKSKNRIISSTLLAEYAYILRPGGILYTITDVHDLHVWMVKHLDEFPLFERIPDDDEALREDVCVKAVWNATEEGKKVIRNRGQKWFAAFRRISDPDEDDRIA